MTPEETIVVCRQSVADRFRRSWNGMGLRCNVLWRWSLTFSGASTDHRSRASGRPWAVHVRIKLQFLYKSTTELISAKGPGCDCTRFGVAIGAWHRTSGNYCRRDELRIWGQHCETCELSASRRRSVVLPPLHSSTGRRDATFTVSICPVGTCHRGRLIDSPLSAICQKGVWLYVLRSFTLPSYFKHVFVYSNLKGSSSCVCQVLRNGFGTKPEMWLFWALKNHIYHTRSRLDKNHQVCLHSPSELRTSCIATRLLALTE